MQGNQGIQGSSKLRHGSIPAHAGEPLCTLVEAVFQGVYPRACGGTLDAHLRPLESAGLSPRMRGNPYRIKH